MSATLTMVPLAKIKPREGFNPRTEFADEQMAELVESVKRHGIITPLTLAPDGDGGFAIIAGERRYRAAKAAKLREVPAQVREADGRGALARGRRERDPRRPDARRGGRAYRRLVDEHGDAAKVAQLVGRSEKLIGERLELLRLPEEARALLAARTVPLACAPMLVRIAEREPLLADLDGGVARGAPARRRRASRPRRARSSTTCSRPSGRTTTGSRCSRSPTASAATTARSSPAAATTRSPRCSPSSARTRSRSRPRSRRCPRSGTRASTTGRRASAEESASAACFALDDDDARRRARVRLPARAPGRDGRGDHRYVTDPEWLADRLAQKIAAHAQREAERTSGKSRDARTAARTTTRRRRPAARSGEREYEERVAARARNLDLGAALARWQPKLDTDAVKLLGSLVLLEHGKAAAWAHRLCVEQPTTRTSRAR